MRSSVVKSERDRFRGAAPSSDVGAGRDLAGGLEEVDEGGDDGVDSDGWHGCDDRRARLEALRVEESWIAIALESLMMLSIERDEGREGGNSR